MINRLSSEFDAFFPTAEQLYIATEDEVRASKCGFRAPYIMDAARQVYLGNVTEEKLKNMDINSARELLMSIHGVGEKVANCVLLFGLGRRQAFPVDVWMKRICEYLYFDGETPKTEIEAYCSEKFGEYSIFHRPDAIVFRNPYGHIAVDNIKRILFFTHRATPPAPPSRAALAALLSVFAGCQAPVAGVYVQRQQARRGYPGYNILRHCCTLSRSERRWSFPPQSELGDRERC